MSYSYIGYVSDRWLYVLWLDLNMYVIELKQPVLYVRSLQMGQLLAW